MLQAFYNTYFDQICVIDNRDIYIYNSDSGKLEGIHENIFHNLKTGTVAFQLDTAARKAYVSSEQGHFKVLNI